MGEPSSEVISPPQAAETKENTSNFGLSVNGSQLIALANLDYLEEHGFASPAKPSLLDRLRIIRYRPAHQRLSAIKELVLKGNTQEAINLLNQSLVISSPTLAGVKNNKLVEGIEATGAYRKDILDALSRDIPVKEACKDHLKFNREFRDFIQSLPGQSLHQLPKENTKILLTELGIEAYVDPKSNTLRLSPEDFLEGTVVLPADQQHPLYIEEREALGESSNDNIISRLEIFAELSKRYPKVFTHITASAFLPKILNSGFIGRPYERGYKNTINSERGGVFAETLTFKDASDYQRVIQELRNGSEKVHPPAEIVGNKGNYPLHELTYVNPNTIDPIAIFSDRFEQKHKLNGWLADDVADIKDDCLIGILVTPQYKQHLLHWVSTWTEEKRQEVFGKRKPEDILISSVRDLPPLEE